jgi:NAD+ kinase
VIVPPQRIAITYNPQAPAAHDLALLLRDDVIAMGREAWVADEEEAASTFDGVELMICLGGDGTVLHAARMLIGTSAVILGVNMGRLGFLTELDGPQVRESLAEVLSGAGRIEERTLLRVEAQGITLPALNDAVVGRATLNRAIQLAVDIEGIRIADYRCDGVIIASATGSTAYALSVGGPILAPESSDMIVVPVAPHLAAQHAVVLPKGETVRVTLEPGQEAALSVDGQHDILLSEGDSVTVNAGGDRARFLRLKPRSDFYVRMAAQLGWHRPGGNAKPLPPVGSTTGREA